MGVRCLLTFLFLSSFVQAQSWQKNRITVSGGWMRQFYAPNPSFQQSAPTVGVSYGYRPLKFLELEAGATVALQPGQQLCNRFGCYDPNDRYFWIPFGVRLIAPLVANRLELSIGGGGLLQRYSVSNPENEFNISSQNGWGGYFSAGAAVALDRRRRFWLGATPRFLLANPEFRRYRWFGITGDVSFRF